MSGNTKKNVTNYFSVKIIHEHEMATPYIQNT